MDVRSLASIPDDSAALPFALPVFVWLVLAIAACVTIEGHNWFSKRNLPGSRGWWSRLGMVVVLLVPLFSLGVVLLGFFLPTPHAPSADAPTGHESITV